MTYSHVTDTIRYCISTMTQSSLSFKKTKCQELHHALPGGLCLLFSFSPSEQQLIEVSKSSASLPPPPRVGLLSEDSKIVRVPLDWQGRINTCSYICGAYQYCGESSSSQHPVPLGRMVQSGDSENRHTVAIMSF